MTASQLLGIALVVSGLGAFALRRDDVPGLQIASDSALFLVGICCILVGAIFLLLSQIKGSVQY